MPRPADLTRELVHHLRAGARLVGALDAELFAQGAEPLARSGIGAHVRHVIDCCQAFVDGAPSGRVDYDARRRDPRVERDPRRAVRLLSALCERLASAALDGDQELRVRSDEPGAGPDEGWQRSTVGRELRYLVSHTVHHYAIVALLLRHAGRDPGADFGVAPSTLSHWRRAERCAPSLG